MALFVGVLFAGTVEPLCEPPLIIIIIIIIIIIYSFIVRFLTC